MVRDLTRGTTHEYRADDQTYQGGRASDPGEKGLHEKAAHGQPTFLTLSLVIARKSYSFCPPNGCELSGRRSLPHMLFQVPASRLSLAFAAASPVRSSELFGGTKDQGLIVSANSWLSFFSMYT